MIKQDHFSILKGHVVHGQQVLMRTGEVWIIESAFPTGWVILDNKDRSDVFPQTYGCAGDVEYKIVNY